MRIGYIILNISCHLIIQNTSISSLRIFDTDYITEKYLISRCFDSSTIFFV